MKMDHQLMDMITMAMVSWRSTWAPIFQMDFTVLKEFKYQTMQIKVTLFHTKLMEKQNIGTQSTVEQYMEHMILI